MSKVTYSLLILIIVFFFLFLFPEPVSARVYCSAACGQSSQYCTDDSTQCEPQQTFGPGCYSDSGFGSNSTRACSGRPEGDCWYFGAWHSWGNCHYEPGSFSVPNPPNCTSGRTDLCSNMGQPAWCCSYCGGCGECGIYSACPAEQSCPTGCGYGGGTVPDGRGGQKTCAPTGSCCTEYPAPTISYGPCDGNGKKNKHTEWNCQADGDESVDCKATIKARAFQISTSDTCDFTSPNPLPVSQSLSNTVHQFSTAPAPNPGSQTQSGASYTTFSNVNGGYYVINSQPPNAANWTLTRACYRRDKNPALTGDASGSYVSANAGGGATDNETLTWDLGYTPPGPWVQTQGGDVYVSGDVKSLIPLGITTRKFNLDDNSYPGVVTYGGSFDFDIDQSSNGSSNVSSKNWLVKDSPTYSTVDLYDTFYRRLGAPTTQNYDPVTQGGAKPSGSGTYYVNSGMTTSGNWSVGSGESIVFLVNGDLTIGGKINVTGTGFVAFIVNGNITVSSSVGVAPSSTSPVVEGVYIAKSAFSTGTSSAGIEKFVGKGMFIANSFNLQRSLGDANNVNYAAELFAYNPQFLITMPDGMKDIPIRWEEVAP